MYHINYTNLDLHYREVMKYCLHSSKTFSVISCYEKPYSKKKIIAKHQKKLQEWEHCLIKQIDGINKWPGTVTNNWNNVMNVYSSRIFRKSIVDIPNLFSPFENDFPEDVCFYRNEKPWFTTVSHERMAYISMPTDEDIRFFKVYGII